MGCREANLLIGLPVERDTDGGILGPKTNHDTREWLAEDHTSDDADQHGQGGDERGGDHAVDLGVRHGNDLLWMIQSDTVNFNAL